MSKRGFTAQDIRDAMAALDAAYKPTTVALTAEQLEGMEAIAQALESEMET